MSGPWEDYASPAPSAGPWQAYQAVDSLTKSVPNAPHGIVNAVISGLESSASGLTYRKALPDQQLPEDATWGERAASNIAGALIDLPYAAAGIIGGGAAGAAVAGPPGGTLGAGAGAFGVPMAVRQALMTAYAQGGVHSWSDVWEVTKSSIEGLGKGGLMGMAPAKAGEVAAAVGGGVVKKATAEIAAMTTAGAALEGRVPTFQDLGDAAVAIAGIHLAGRAVVGLRNIYAKTGTAPSDVALDAMKNPELKAAITENPDEIPAPYKAKALEEAVQAAVPGVEDRATAARFAENPFAPIEQKAGEPTRPTHINYNYINGGDELSGVLSRLSGLYEERIQTARRGTVSWEQTQAESKQVLADALGISADKIQSEPGVPTAKLAATLQAKRQLAVDAAQELKAQGKALADLGANATDAQVTAFMAHTERASMILADFLGMRAEVARAQNSLKAAVSPSLDLSGVQKLIEGYGGKDKVLDFARVMGDADSPTSALRTAQAFVKPTLLDKTLEFWKASILSGPTTHLANVFGNVASAAMKFPERLTAAALGQLHGGEKVTVAEVRALASGMVQGSLDGLTVAGQAAKDAFALKEQAASGAKTEQYKNAIGGKVGEAVRIPFKLLTAEDALFRTMNERGEAHALAVRQALKEGLGPDTREFNSRVVDIVQNPTEEFAQAVKDAGDRAVFTQKLGKTGTHLQMAVKGTPLEFILPFIKTPANLLKWAAEYTPGVNLFMESVRNDLAGKNGAVARDLAISRMVIGGTVAALVAEGVNNGTITGGGLADPETRRAKTAAGWQPYSIKIGDTYYSYQRIDPVARLLATAADTMEIYHAAGENDKLPLAGAITSAVGNATISQTYLSGLANAVNAITDPNRYGARWLDQYAASLVPGALGQTASAIDPKAREVNGLLDAIQARIPIWREQMLAKKNPLTGEDVAATDRLFPFAPVTTSELSKDKVLTEAMRLGVNLPVAPRNVQVGRGVGKMGRVDITPEARNAFAEEQGRFAHEILSQIVNTPAWDAIPDMIKSSVYQKIISAARAQGTLKALPPEARAAEMERITNDITTKLVAPNVAPGATP